MSVQRFRREHEKRPVKARVRYSSLILTAVLLVAGCAPGVSSPRADEQSPAAPAIQRALVSVDAGENPDYATRQLTRASGGLFSSQARDLFNADLVFKDERGLPHPFLAEALPELNTSSWQVFPDGKMELTYRLKPNLTWQDGQPLTAEDFVFAWRVYSNPVFGVSTSGGLGYVEAVSASDPRTVVLRWKTGYPDALTQVGLVPPLPQHILDQPYQQLDPQQFVGLPFWRQEYVGLGPWRMARYEPGVMVEGEAFDGFVFGRPRIDRVQVIYRPDTRVGIVALLSGEAHFAMNSYLRDEDGPVLEESWAQNKAGIVLSEPIAPRAMEFQGRPEYAVPTELASDVRVRQAIAHAIDREALLEVLTNNKGILRDVFAHPKEEYYDVVARAAPSRYRPDPRRAQTLLEEAGFARGADGQWRTPKGERFTLDQWFLASAGNERESTIVVDGLRRFGIDASSQVWGVQRSSAEERAKISGMFAGSVYLPEEYHTRNIARPENRWSGTNRYGYSNPQLDRLLEAWETTLDRSQRIEHIAQVERLVNVDLPSLPMYFRVRVLGYSSALAGVVENMTPGAGSERRVWEWYWRA